jgi:integrase/recombinase XerD
MTLHECQTSYEATNIYHWRPLTHKKYSVALERIVGFLGKDRDPKTVFTQDATSYLNSRAKEGAPFRMLRQERLIGKMLWDHIADLGYVERLNNPFKRVKVRGREPEFIRRALDTDTRQRLFEACRTERERLVLRILEATPFSACMVATLKREDFDFERKTVTVRRSKTGRVVCVPVPDSLLNAVFPYPPGPLWSVWARASVPGNRVSRLVSVLAQRIGADLSSHDFRHTYATDAVQEGYDLRTVQELLGHANIVTTMRYVAPKTVEETRPFLKTRLEFTPPELVVQPQ